MHVCMYVDFVLMDVWMDLYVCAYKPVLNIIFMYINECMCVQYVCMYVHMYVCAQYVRISMYIYVCMFINPLSTFNFCANVSNSILFEIYHMLYMYVLGSNDRRSQHISSARACKGPVL